MKKYILLLLSALTTLPGVVYAMSQVLVESVTVMGSSVNIKGVVTLDFNDRSDISYSKVDKSSVYLVAAVHGLDLKSMLLGSGPDGDYKTIGEWLRNIIGNGPRTRRFDFTLNNPYGDGIDIKLSSQSVGYDAELEQFIKLIPSGEFSGANCKWNINGDMAFNFSDVSRELDHLGAEAKRNATYDIDCSSQKNFKIKALPNIIEVSDNLEAKITFNGQQELSLTPFSGTRPIVVETTLTRTSMTGKDYGDFEAWAVIVTEMD